MPWPIASPRNPQSGASADRAARWNCQVRFGAPPLRRSEGRIIARYSMRRCLGDIRELDDGPRFDRTAEIRPWGLTQPGTWTGLNGLTGWTSAKHFVGVDLASWSGVVH